MHVKDDAYLQFNDHENAAGLSKNNMMFGLEKQTK